MSITFKHLQNSGLRAYQNALSTMLFERLPRELRDYSIFLSVAVISLIIVFFIFMGLIIFAGTRAQPTRASTTKKSKKHTDNRYRNRSIRLRSKEDDKFGLSSPFDSDTIPVVNDNNNNFSGGSSSKATGSPIFSLNSFASIPSPIAFVKGLSAAASTVKDSKATNKKRTHRRRKSIEPKYSYIEFEEESCYEPDFEVSSEEDVRIAKKPHANKKNKNNKTKNEKERDRVRDSYYTYNSEGRIQLDEDSVILTRNDIIEFESEEIEYDTDEHYNDEYETSEEEEEEEEAVAPKRGRGRPKKQTNNASGSPKQKKDVRKRRSGDNDLPRPGSSRRIVAPERFVDLVFDDSGPGYPLQ